MKALQNLRQILKTISQDVEVLPAVGGAVEDLERPDFEEREDQALNEEEKVFETIFERDPSGPPPACTVLCRRWGAPSNSISLSRSGGQGKRLAFAER